MGLYNPCFICREGWWVYTIPVLSAGRVGGSVQSLFYLWGGVVGIYNPSFICREGWWVYNPCVIHIYIAKCDLSIIKGKVVDHTDIFTNSFFLTKNVKI